MRDKFATIQGFNIRYWDIGSIDNPNILLIHGIGASIESWAPLIEFLKNDFHIVAIDLPGFGRSDQIPNVYSARSTEIFRDFVEQVNLNNFSIIGHSLGGYIALELLSQQNLPITNLVLIGSAGFGFVSPVFKFFATPFSKKFLLPFVANNFAGPLVLQFFYGNKLGKDINHQMANYWKDKKVSQAFVEILLNAGEESIYSGLDFINCPVQLIWGEQDWVLKVSHAKRAKKLIPHARLTIISKGGHCVHTVAPAKVNPIIKQFLSN
jgi:pimeloyl-ACP methyl ester carboxylesterase